MKEDTSESRHQGGGDWTNWFGGLFSRPVVRNNIAGFAEVMMVLHLWLSGVTFGVYAVDDTKGRWASLCLLLGGIMWLFLARIMREKFARMDAERVRSRATDAER